MTAKTKIAQFAEPDELAKAAARQFGQAASNSPSESLNVAMAGGRIYSLFLKALEEEAQKSSGVLDRVHFFWSDERCVPPAHPESNYRVAEEELLRPLGISPERIHRIQGELKPAAAAEIAEREARSLLPSTDDVPVFDYVFLGMGEDGHVASLFPGEPIEQIQSKAVYRPVVGPKPPPNRVTLGYPSIWAAKEVWLLVSGKEKSGALKQSLGTGAGTPLARALSRRSKTLVFTDCEI